MTDEIVRAFFAVDLDDATRRAAMRTAQLLRESPDGKAVRWVRGGTLHITLRFLGDVEVGRIEPLVGSVRKQTASLRSFRLELGSAHPFPSRRRPNAIVLDVGPKDRLEELAEAVERGTVEAGFEPEPRPFRAHLTLGRVRGKRFPVVTADVTAVGEGCRVGEAVLFRSELHRSGAQYTPIARVPFDNQSVGASPSGLEPRTH